MNAWKTVYSDNQQTRKSDLTRVVVGSNLNGIERWSLYRLA